MNSAFRTPHSASAPDPLLSGLDAAAGALQQQAAGAAWMPFGQWFRQHEPPTDGGPYCYGVHTRKLIAVLEHAYREVKAGRRYFCCVAMPPRHGKSDIISRRFPAYVRLHDPDLSVISASYSAELARTLALDCHRLCEELAPAYRRTFDPRYNAVDAWRWAGHGGEFHSAGLTGSITGFGAHFLLVDDPIKGREDAESQRIRDKVWDTFRADLMTRCAPASAVVMTYTRWHQDDPRGRIEKLMRANPHFPRFEFIEFDAEADENAPDDSPQHWLFPERFSPASYLETRATMGAYDWAALYRQRPRAKEGNLFKVDRIRIIQQEQLPANLRWQWGWDIAGTEKQINKSDPDYTVGIKAAVQDGCVYIARMIRGQWSAEQRLQIMEQVGKADGPAVPHAYEVVALGVDAYNIIARRLRRSGIVVRKFAPSGKGDKIVRSTPLQSVCELGQLFLVAAGWNDTLIDEFAAFPTGGTHDDIIDAAVTATYDELQERRRVGLEPVF